MGYIDRRDQHHQKRRMYPEKRPAKVQSDQGTGDYLKNRYHSDLEERHIEQLWAEVGAHVSNLAELIDACVLMQHTVACFIKQVRCVPDTCIEKGMVYIHPDAVDVKTGNINWKVVRRDRKEWAELLQDDETPPNVYFIQ